MTLPVFCLYAALGLFLAATFGVTEPKNFRFVPAAFALCLGVYLFR